MLINEAKWIGNSIPLLQLNRHSVVLNFGSQNQNYNKESRHIMDYVINPLKENYQLRNLDIKSGVGIDYSGNIFDDIFFDELKTHRFDCILLCNVLEHVTDIQLMINRIIELIPPNGYIIITVPYKYPVHFDPIDNLYRPNVDELTSLLKGFTLIKGEIITDYSYSYYLLKNIKTLLLTVLRASLPFYKYKKWKEVAIPKFAWWNKKFKVTCVIMKKNN
jgi:SAM-dependent methyltransferase